MPVRNLNTILGAPLQVGNPEQIKWVRQMEKILSGELNICEADWEYVQWAGKTDETRKPITYHVNPENADAVQCYIPCPRCHRIHKHVICYDPNEILSTEMWHAIETADISCWNCGLEFYIDDDGSRNIYVKIEEEII